MWVGGGVVPSSRYLSLNNAVSCGIIHDMPYLPKTPQPRIRTSLNVDFHLVSSILPFAMPLQIVVEQYRTLPNWEGMCLISYVYNDPIIALYLVTFANDNSWIMLLILMYRRELTLQSLYVHVFNSLHIPQISSAVILR